MPRFTADEKSEVLRTLQREIYFEKSISASSAYFHGNSALTLPSSFVQEHGDKFGKSVTLRCGSSPKPWTVKLTIARRSASACKVQVKLSAGWRAFAASNDLLAGDSLVFHLTAMSEFTVLVFHANKSCGNSLKGSEPSRMKAKQENEQLVDAGFSGGDKIGLLRMLQGSIHFQRTLSASSASQFRSSELEFAVTLRSHSKLLFDLGLFLQTLPSRFVREHGDKLRKSVTLRTQSSAKRWDVNLSIQCRSSTSSRVKLTGGWRAFADFHRLLKGDVLVFSLTAVSKFQVYVFSGKQIIPASRNDGSQRIGEQFYECTETADGDSGGKAANAQCKTVSGSELLEHFSQAASSLSKLLDELHSQQHLSAWRSQLLRAPSSSTEN